MREFLDNTRKIKLFALILFILVASFDGVVLSMIISYAGKITSKVGLLQMITFGAISIAAWSFVYVAQYFVSVLSSSIIKDININLKEKYFWNKYYNSEKIGDSASVLSNLTNDFKLVENQYFLPLISMVSNVLLCAVSLIYMIHYNGVIALFFIAFSFLPMIVPKFFSKRLSNTAKIWSKSNKIFLMKLKDFFQGSSVLKVYKSTPYIVDEVRKQVGNIEESSFSLNKTEAKANYVASILSGISFIVPFILGCILIKYNQKFDISSLLAIFLLNDRVVGPLQSIIAAFNEIASTKEIRKKIFVYSRFELDNPKKNSVVQKKIRIQSLSFNNISYIFANGKMLKINLKLNSKVNSPFKVLIFGESGSGKSTILNLIQNKLNAREGKIKALDQFNNAFDLNGNIAYIAQKPYIFNTTLFDNVTLFQKGIPKIDVLNVLKKVDLYTELGEEEALQYQCGMQGNKLSGGQCQRVEIARALLFKKALYLVDEVTANLDRENSEKIRNILFNIKSPVIEVAHHFNSNDKRYTDMLKLEHGELISVKKRRSNFENE